MKRSLFPPLPQGWRSVPAKHAAVLNPEVLPESTPEDTELSYVDIAALEGGDAAVSLSPKALTFGTAPSRARRVLRQGDTILSTVRTYLKAVANFPEAPEGLVASTGFAVLRPNGQLNPRFAYWATLSEPFIENVVAHSEGVSYPAINPSVLGSLHLPVPPLIEQQRIANFLDEQTARIDALIAEKEQLLLRLGDYLEATLFHLLRPESQVTRGFSLPKLAYFVVQSNAGEVIDKSWWNEGSELLYTCARQPLASNFVGFPVEKRTGPRDLLLTRNGTPYVHRPEQGSIYTNVVQRVTLKGGVDLQYLMDAIQVAAWSMKGYGVSIESLNYEMWAALRIWVPGLDEQRRIAEEISTVKGRVENLTSHVSEHIIRLREYRSSLISAAVTGRLDLSAFK